MKYALLIPSVLVICFGLSFALRAGEIDPPAGPVSATGRFGPKVDVLTLPGSSSSTHTITESGSYYLSRNLQGSAGLNAIRVEAPNVTIDLNGFSIDANGGDGIRTGSSAGGFLVIKNGDLFNAEQGIPANTIELITIQNLTIRDCSTNAINTNAGNTRIVDCQVLNAGSEGIRVAGNNGIISGCVVTNSVGRGITTNSSFLVENCVSLGNGIQDIQILDGLVRGCVASTILLLDGSISVDNHQP